MATIAELRKGLAATTVPDATAAKLIKGASSLWLSSDSATQLTGDLALVHPRLKKNEVRARAVAAVDSWRLTVVAKDRKGLLADSAAILSAAGYSLRGASVVTWTDPDIALHAITVEGAAPSDEQLDAIGAQLRAANSGDRPKLTWQPVGRAYVRRTGEANGDAMISVVCPDQQGLLAAICRWFNDAGVSIRAAWIAGAEEANDVFVIHGDVDVVALERHLSADVEDIRAVAGNMFTEARDIGETVIRGALDLVRGLLTRK